MEQAQVFSIRGFARVKILQDGKVVGDSGLKGSNRITQTGLSDFLVRVLAADAGSQIVNYAQLGTGTEPATNSTRLPGEITDNSDSSYESVSRSTLTASTAITMRWYGTFDSSQNFVTTTHAIQNIGLYSTTGGAMSLACGQTYGVSTVDTNQDVQFTYEWQIQTTSA